MKKLNHIEKAAAELAQLCMHINLVTKYHAWFDYSGHVNHISIRIQHKDKKKNKDNGYLTSTDFYIDRMTREELNSNYRPKHNPSLEEILDKKIYLENIVQGQELSGFGATF